MWISESSAAAITAKPSSRVKVRDATRTWPAPIFLLAVRLIALEFSDFGGSRCADNWYGASPHIISPATARLAFNLMLPIVMHFYG